MNIATENRTPGDLSEFTRWSFEPTGDHSIDCATGRRIAHDYLAFREDPCFAPALGWIVTAIGALNRPHSGIETGFFHALNGALATCDLPASGPCLRVIDGGKSS